MGVSLACYIVSRRNRARSNDLDTVQAVDKLDDLATIASSGPVIAAVRGFVESGKAKKCELSKGSAVMSKIEEHEIYSKVRTNGSIALEPQEVRKVIEDCEWFIRDSTSKSTVKVDNARAAASIETTMEVKQTYTPEPGSDVIKFAQRLAGFKVKQGTRKTETYLPVGSVVTAIGEVTRNPLAPGAPPRLPDARNPLEALGDVCPFILRKPTQGPFYITRLTLEQLQAELNEWARNLRYIFMACGGQRVAGKCMPVHQVLTYVLKPFICGSCTL